MSEIICPSCEGTGMIGTITCTQCKGIGKCDYRGIYGVTVNVCEDILDKCNKIQTEQASQREDLTVILTQIWNKVKDL